jgi:hypothetical protein
MTCLMRTTHRVLRETRLLRAICPKGGVTRDGYFLTYFCTRQFSVSATKISSRGLTAM